MAIELSKDETAQVVASIHKYFKEELEQDISDMQARFLLDYILKEIAPLAYNKGVADAEAYVSAKLDDMPGTCFAQGLTYWRQRRK